VRAAARRAGAGGRLTAPEAIERSLERYAAWEPQLRAFAWCDPERARVQAAAAAGSGGALAGVPVGVKDVFDTAAIPTEYGSPIFAGRVPERTAVAVARLEAAGAVVLGKTVTAELAYYAPGPTSNPWNAGRTPGGSSMGSAAAVAAGVVPAAIGTQTNGSTIRPAAFCGVVGFKPSFGRLPTAGALQFAPTLDTVGVFATSVADASLLAEVIAGETDRLRGPGGPPLLAVVRSPEWDEVEPAAQEAFETAAGLAREAGAELRELELPEALAGAIPVVRTIMAAEASRFVAPLVAGELDRVSEELRALLDEGAAMPPGQYERALATREELVAGLGGLAPGCDALLAPATLGEAPPLDTTGDPRPCTRWSLVGAPALSLPSGLGPHGLPLAVQLVGMPGRDRRLLEVASWLEPLLPDIGSPPQPS
jgi:Asp-tRNA(Asn)/Glu-tRNA(Gln) amidotransferase A subunit family amidase